MLQTTTGIPTDDELSDKLAIAVTSYGGHIGFLEGIFPRHESYMDRVFSEYVYAVFNHIDRLVKKDT